MEELAELKTELASVQRRLTTLARVVNDDLLRVPRGNGLTDRGYRWFRRRRVQRTQEWRDVRAIEDSGLFDGPWYLATYPKAAASGLNPALHYLRIGAGEGYDPGPRFSAAAYLSSHPKAARSGANPVLHYVKSRRAGGRAPRRADGRAR